VEWIFIRISKIIIENSEFLITFIGENNAREIFGNKLFLVTLSRFKELVVKTY